MNTSGIVFDVFDDFDGTVLRTIYPTVDVVPSPVKTAAAYSPEQMQQLPDDVFGLVTTVDTDLGPCSFRKYACTDPGNTDLSVRYFLASGRQHLPGDLRKEAAQRLAYFCEQYDLPVDEELQKEALVGAVVRLPEIAGAYQESKANLRAARMAPPGAVLTPHQIDKLKTAELANTHIQSGPKPAADRKPKATSVVKTGALRGRYPLDTPEQVKLASTYFDTYGSGMTLEDRREYCLNTAARARELGVGVSEKIAAYGATTYAPHHVMQMGIELRKQNMLDEVKLAQLDRLFAAATVIDPGTYCGALVEFDKEAGLSDKYHAIPDPYLSTFGVKKVASFSEDIDGEPLTGEQLRSVATGDKMKAFTDTFGKDVAKEFSADPVGIFSSMPRQQKQLIARMARGA